MGWLKRPALLCFFIFPLYGYALTPKLVLDKVTFPLTAKRWVNTSTAKLQVTVNATLTAASLIEMRHKIMDNLSQIANAKWHITQFNRSQDNSGLEKVYVNAEARVEQAALAKVNALAKKISQPGTHYQINNIDFSPSMADVEKVKRLLRSDIYNLAQLEIDKLNKQYPNQVYSIYRLTFVPPSSGSFENKRYQRMQENVQMLAATIPAQLTVSNEVQLFAVVTVASKRT